MLTKDEYKSVSSLLLGAVSASLVLFPSILSVVAKPLTAIWVMWLYLACGLIAFAALALTYYRASFTSGEPIRASGIGTILACLSIVFFAAFLFLNLLSDQMAPPAITTVSSNAYVAAPGEVLTLSAHGDDQNGDRLTWDWRVQSADPKIKSAVTPLPSKLESAAWRIPETAALGPYKVTVTASDGSHNSSPETLQVEVRKKP